ncbi:MULTISPECIES: hypothetical protein [unclassified Lentimonas]|uniref:hypothetical protein n=1 Tax=unclassified Lentimonas TaxID=2630993 RepID=UPI00132C88AC|nr:MULTISPECIES: hypothetical protein [unclassified Lentimonas]CAA6691896.1 Unannotated [Lentimonas sp. CC19]CAA6694640.1 Unannotated [Lentimonas sp. CC10]CAA7072155.1 Unannotated [Lentimonas sp. CC11]
MKHPIAFILIAAAALLSGCNESEKVTQTEWPSYWFWAPAPAHDTWPAKYAPYQKYKTENTWTEASVNRFLDISDIKIKFKPYDSSTHFLTVQVMIYDKKQDKEMKVCSLPHQNTPNAEDGIYLYIAIAPEEFGKNALFDSPRWKLYIESGVPGTGPYEIRELIPNLSAGAEKGSSITFHLQRKDNKEGTPYIAFADTSNYEIRIYSHLVEIETQD